MLRGKVLVGDTLMIKHRLLTIINSMAIGGTAALSRRAIACCIHPMPDPKVMGQARSKEIKDRVVLSAAKLAKAGIRNCRRRARRVMQPVRTVPGRIDYNGTRHISHQISRGRLVRKMAVIVGDRVEAGQSLAIVNCPELGERRSDVLREEAELELARREHDWWQTIQTNLEEVIGRLKRPQQVDVLEQDFADRI